MKFYKFSFTLLLFISLVINQPVYSQITPGVITSHDANATMIYHWFSYVPTNMIKTRLSYILITGQNGNIISDDYNDQIDECRSLADWRKDWADTYNYIMLTPVIPRSASNFETYTVSLDRESLIDPNDFNQRPDLKLNLMINELISLLRADGYNVHDKVFIEGFSAGAMFAQRYCLLHPERVQAIAAGQCGGSMTVPGSNFNGTDMNWPVGINDFQSLVGYSFNLSSYKTVPQFIYIGDQDTNNSTVAVGNYDLFTDDQRDFLNQNFGNSDPVRVESQYDYMIGMGCDVVFKSYPGVGHQMTSGMVNDIFTFFNAYTDSSPLIIKVPLDVNTIQEAIDGARNGDTILVSDGTFKGLGNKNINFNGKEITVKSLNGPNNCIINCEGEGRGFVFENNENENSVLQGFKIINGQEEFGGGIYLNNSSPKITNCIISENSADHGAGIYGFNTSAIFSNCTILNNNATGSGVNYFHSSSPTIINSIISKNTAGHGAGLFFYESTGDVINCTITGNTASGAGGMYCNGSNPTIVNTIFWDNSPDEFGFDNSNPSISYCLIQGGYVGEGNIDNDPLFVDPDNNDYHISEDSPCKDAGDNNAPGLPVTDMDGNPRIVDGVVDMGAYEYSGSFLLNELAADFGANGLWNYDGNTWKKLTAWDPDDDMAGWVTLANCLAVDFGTNGLWNYDGIAWRKKTSWNAGSGGMTGWTGGLAVDFDGNGLWNYNGTTWNKKTSWNPDNDLVGWDGGLAVDFGSSGLWNYDGTTWSKKTNWNPGSGGMAGWSGGLAVDFDGSGLWNYNGTTWSKKTSWNPGSGGLCGWSGGLAVDFDGNGLWNYSGTTWSKKTSWDPESMCPLGNGLAVDFGVNGVWYYDGTTWSKKTNWNAENLTDLDLY